MPGVRQFEKLQRDDRQGVGARIVGLFRCNPHPWEVIGAIEAQRAAETEAQRQQEAAEKRLKEQKEPVIEALNNSGLDFSKSFTVTFRPGRRQELSDSNRDRWHHLAYIDAEFNADNGSLRILRGTTTEYPGAHLRMPKDYRYTAPRAHDEEYFFNVTTEAGEGGTGIVMDMSLDLTVEKEWDTGRAYDFAGSALRQLQHYQYRGATTNYFDGPAEPLDRPETPNYCSGGPNGRNGYRPYPPDC